MFKIIPWIKSHKLITFLVLVVAYLLLTKYYPQLDYLTSSQVNPQFELAPSADSLGMMRRTGIGGMPNILPQPEAPPVSGINNRLVAKESYLSLLVKDVTTTQEQIVQTAQSLGGYLVNSYINNPQDNPYATITVRVPTDRFQDILKTYRSLAVKVVTENLSGEDLTDQYVDNQARLNTLEKTKAKFEDILDKATRIEDILNVQQQIINLQAQIDSVTGQQKYLQQTAQMAKLTIYLSTDELALPYAPSESWRPEVIFKEAVRSVIALFRRFASALIWVAVYGIIWLPLLILLIFLKKKFRQNN